MSTNGEQISLLLAASKLLGGEKLPMVQNGSTVVGNLSDMLNSSITAAETAAGVTPANTTYKNGPFRYGAVGNGVNDDSIAWTAMGKIGGQHLVADGTYLFSQKAQISNFLSIIGFTRQNTIIQGGAFSDYVLEMGSAPSGPNPNVGALQRFRFLSGSASNLGMLHMANGSHLWRLDDLLFQGNSCPALVITNCWDSNYTNIAIYSSGTPNQPPSVGAALQLKGGCNNHYYRGLHLEGCNSGSIYADNCAQIHMVEGKIDNGFSGGQLQPSITITGSGSLNIDEFYIGGQTTYQIVTSGALKLGKVIFDGGTGQPAAIKDLRAWAHQDPSNFAGISDADIGPSIPPIDLGAASFFMSHPSSLSLTPAAVYSKIPGIRLIKNLSVTANGGATSSSIQVQTNLVSAVNNQYKACFLVHNSTGTQNRRFIQQSFTNGLFVLAGSQGVTIDGDWSIEYCQNHSTPMQVGNISLSRGQSLFSVISGGLIVTTPPLYISAVADAAYGCTKFGIAGGVFEQEDVTGMYLIDELTGEPYYINYGIDAGGYIGIMYDRTASINTAATYTIQAGYSANVRVAGSYVEWKHAGNDRKALISELTAAGYSPQTPPLWGFGSLGKGSDTTLATLPFSASIAVDASRANEFLISISSASAFTIQNPVYLGSNARILRFTLVNNSGAVSGQPSFGSNYRAAAFATLAAGVSRSIQFRWDGISRLIEVGRTPNDIPN